MSPIRTLALILAYIAGNAAWVVAVIQLAA